MTIFDKVKKFITLAHSQSRFLLVLRTEERRRAGREPGNEFFSIEVLRFFSSMLSELTQQDGGGKKTANLV